jgi:hypothetical protein
MPDYRIRPSRCAVTARANYGTRLAHERAGYSSRWASE